LKLTDFDKTIMYPECAHSPQPYQSEPSIRMLIRRYYLVHMDKAEADVYTERYIAAMLANQPLNDC